MLVSEYEHPGVQIMRTAKYIALGICGTAFIAIGIDAGIKEAQHPTQKPEIFDSSLFIPAKLRETITRSCAACHATGTKLPWYAAIPPASWLVAEDMRKAKLAMDLTHWSSHNGRSPGKTIGTLMAMCNDVTTGRMPMKKYVWMHPDAKLKPDEIRNFCGWTADQIAQAKVLKTPQKLALSAPPPAHR